MNTSNLVDLTFSQCKNIISCGGDLREVVEQMNNQPEYLAEMGSITSIDEMKSILEGGCMSGAYMPATSTYIAKEAYKNHSEELESIVSDVIGENFDLCLNTLSVKVCCLAVEIWVSQFSEYLESM